jgi:itaconate CoA-transferase
LSFDLPFAGLTVISIEQAVAAPLATRHLADLGARVIKIERPETGDFARGYDESVHGQSSYFVWLNRSKESLTLDLKSATGVEILHELLDGADVFIQNLGPGAARRIGLDEDTLAAKYPGLITCAITGFGSDGSWADRKAYDLLVQAECGLVSITGSADDMAKTAISIADIAAGMYAFAAIQSALYVRATTGRAPAVSVSLFDALADWMGSPAYYTRYGGTSPDRVGAEHATIAPYGPYEAGDGHTLVVAIQNDGEWARFSEQILHDPTLASRPAFLRNSDRVKNRRELNLIVQKCFAKTPAAELIKLLGAARIAYADVNTMRQFVDHPLLSERNRWRELTTPGGPVEALIPAASMSGVGVRMDPVPALGEHTDAILSCLGRTPQDIGRLKAAHVV